MPFFCKQQKLAVEHLLPSCSNLNNTIIIVYGRGNLDLAKILSLEIIIEEVIDFLNHIHPIEKIWKCEFMLVYL